MGNTSHHSHIPEERTEIPLRSATHGTLVFLRGASLLSMNSQPLAANLCSAHFVGPQPQVQERNGIITVRYRRISPAEWAKYLLLWGHRANTVDLNTAVPWSIEIRGGASNIQANLRTSSVASFSIAGGASKVRIDLPQPQGIVPIQIMGGANTITIRRPHTTAISLQIHHGAHQVSLDEQYIGTVGGNCQIATPNIQQAKSSYLIEIRGGASNIAIDRWDSSN